MNFFDHKDLGNHLLQLCPKVVKHPVYIYIYIYICVCVCVIVCVCVHASIHEIHFTCLSFCLVLKNIFVTNISCPHISVYVNYETYFI